MREELRRRIPRTRGWYTGILLGIVALIGAIVLLIWRSLQAESPERTVKAAMEAAQRGDISSIRALLSPESLMNPSAEEWLKQLSAALAKPGAGIADVDILRDNATVHVLVPHRGPTGGIKVTDVGVKTTRSEQGWLIDLQQTMASANPQFWLAIMVCLLYTSPSPRD